MRTASKRRTLAPRAPRENRENTAPASIRRTRSTAKRLGQLPEQETDQENGDVNTKKADKAPSKHTLREEQGGSPTKINSHFRTSKLVEGKLRDREVTPKSENMANEVRTQMRHPLRLNSRLLKNPAFETLCSIRLSHPGIGCKWELNRQPRVLHDTLISLRLPGRVPRLPLHSLYIRKPGNCSLEVQILVGLLVGMRNERRWPPLLKDVWSLRKEVVSTSVDHPVPEKVRWSMKSAETWIYQASKFLMSTV